MLHSSKSRLSILLASLLVVCNLGGLRAQDDSHHSRKYKTPPLAAHVEITVLRASSGKPISNAHVIFHPIQGDKDTGYLEVKTNEDGKAVIEVLPIGDTVRMQIIATGFQTYGKDYKIDKSEITMEVRMNRPGTQYSTYDNGAGSGTQDGSGKSAESPKDTPPAPSNDQPAGSDQPKTDQPQPKSN